MEAKELYRSMNNAAGIKIGELKAKAETALRAIKKQLKKTAFDGARNKFSAFLESFNPSRTKSLSGIF